MEYIEIKKLRPHDKNPRKDVGNVKELADSLKKNGIMQNLTVIPDKDMWKAYAGAYRENPSEELRNLMNGYQNADGYTLLIGHRRFAAAKKAGIGKLPCKIVEGLSLKDQIGIMMEENMQRNDLTIVEQAEGFQLMLDLGDTPETISEKTGFSQATVYHRLNIAKLDKEAVAKATGEDNSFQMTLKDMYKLEKIKDIEKRNDVLRLATDPSNLHYRINQAVNEEKAEVKKQEFESILEAQGFIEAPPEVKENQRNYEQLKYVYVTKDSKFDDIDYGGQERDLYYIKPEYLYGSYTLLAAKEESEERPKEETTAEPDRKSKIRENRAEIEKMTKQVTAELDAVVKDAAKGRLSYEGKEKELFLLMWDLIEKEEDFEIYREDLYNFIDNNLIELDEDDEEAGEKLAEKAKELPVLTKLLIYCNAQYQRPLVNYRFDTESIYDPEEGAIFSCKIKIMEVFGYTPSKEVQQLAAGTHPLYRIEAEEESEN